MAVGGGGRDKTGTPVKTIKLTRAADGSQNYIRGNTPGERDKRVVGHISALINKPRPPANPTRAEFKAYAVDALKINALSRTSTKNDLDINTVDSRLKPASKSTRDKDTGRR